MSLKSLLRHRCTILRQDIDLASGSPIYQWVEVKTGVRCFVDLNFVRQGKDQLWTPEAGRPTERAGVAFFMSTAPIKNGDWIKMTTGPSGTFELQAAIDEAWQPTRLHHLEIAVKEIPAAFVSGQNGAPLPTTDPVPVPVRTDDPDDLDGVVIPVPDPTDTGSL